MLEARALQKRYRGRLVVDDVDIRVDRGQVIGLLGPNGAGKTTCFDMIVGLVEPDGGAIQLDGDDVTSSPVSARAHRGLGYLPQEASIFRNLDVAANVMAALELRKDLDRTGRRSLRDRLLDELSVTHLAERKGMALSGGERRRVEIARALAMSPVYMLLDEPFAGIDPISVGDIRETVRHLVDRGIGVLITDHNVRETLDICDEAYILSGGKILAHGTPTEVMADESVRDVYLGRDFRL